MHDFIKRTREYPRQFWLIFWGMLISTTGAFMILPFLMVYASERLNLPLMQTATLITINSAAGIIMTFIAGPVVDRFGRKIVMVVSLFSAAIVYLFLGHAGTYTQFAILMLLLGASNPLYRIGANVMLADLIDPEKRAEAYSLQRLSFNVGIAIGPSIGGFLAATSQYIAFYIAAVGLFLFGLLVVFFAVETLPAEQKAINHQEKDRWGGYGRILKDWPFTTMTLNVAFGLITASLIWILMPVYGTKVIGIPKQLYGFIPTTNALMVVFLQVFVTQWTNKYPPLRMIALGMLFYSLGVGSVALGAGFWGLWTSMVIMTVGELILAPTGITYASNLAPVDMRGRYMSVYNLTWSVAMGIGPLLGGFLSDNFGPPSTWVGGLIIGLISMVMFFVIERVFDKSKYVQIISA